MIEYKKVHTAFTLIEVIFVLVILGIIASIASSLIVKVYESYITQNALYKVSTKTELVANQIANRLTYAISSSTISKVTDSNGLWSGDIAEDIGWIQLKNIMFGHNEFRSIEWIGFDNDSFSASITPGWSGVANYNSSTRNILNTPASDLTLSRDIIFNLSDNEVDLNTNNPNSAVIIFREKNHFYTDISEYSPLCMGLIESNNTECVFPVQRNSDTQLKFIDVNKSKIVTERYKLAWSAYAIVPTDPDGDNLWDLTLHYNYQPWNGENYNSPTTSKKLLMKNVSVFKFTKNGSIIQFKLCASENIGSNFPISTCKEKVVLR